MIDKWRNGQKLDEKGVGVNKATNKGKMMGLMSQGIA
jgi:hypothetical protein